MKNLFLFGILACLIFAGIFFVAQRGSVDMWALRPAPMSGSGGMSMSHGGMAWMDRGSDTPSASGFDLSRESVRESVPTPIVDLADGDQYELRVSAVRKRIGNAEFSMLAYNGSIPGPVLRVPRGAKISLSLANDLSTLDTTLHSHGVRLDDEYDGVPASQGGRTSVSAAGGSAVSYELRFPDYGAFWYHPHIRDDIGQGLGLYGNYIVTDTASGYTNPVNREEYVILSDLLTEGNRTAEFSGDTVDHALMGRYGNVLLANGTDDYRIPAKRGETIRFYITDAASARTFKVSIADTDLKLVGSDMGKYPRETMTGAVVVGPAERAVFEARFDKVGTYELRHVTPARTYVLGHVTVSDESIPEDFGPSFGRLAVYSTSELGYPDLASWLNKAPDKRLKFDIAMKGMGMGHSMSGMSMGNPVPADGIEWEDDMGTMNAMMTDKDLEWRITDEETGRVNAGIDWSFSVGTLAKIRLSNPSDSMHPMQHPFHLHGQRFLVLSVDGVPNDNPVWKDTVLVPIGRTVDILADFSNPGEWMAHCHIAEHLHSGMMFGFLVR